MDIFNPTLSDNGLYFIPGPRLEAAYCACMTGRYLGPIDYSDNKIDHLFAIMILLEPDNLIVNIDGKSPWTVLQDPIIVELLKYEAAVIGKMSPAIPQKLFEPDGCCKEWDRIAKTKYQIEFPVEADC